MSFVEHLLSSDLPLDTVSPSKYTKKPCILTLFLHPQSALVSLI